MAFKKWLLVVKHIGYKLICVHDVIHKLCPFPPQTEHFSPNRTTFVKPQTNDCWTSIPWYLGPIWCGNNVPKRIFHNISLWIIKCESNQAKHDFRAKQGCSGGQVRRTETKMRRTNFPESLCVAQGHMGVAHVVFSCTNVVWFTRLALFSCFGPCTLRCLT